MKLSEAVEREAACGRPKARGGVREVKGMQSQAKESSMKNPIVRAASSIQLQSRRRSFIQAAAATAASVIVPSTWAQPAPRFAASPVALGVIDVAGNLALTHKIFDNYAVAHKDRVSRFAITRSPETGRASR